MRQHVERVAIVTHGGVLLTLFEHVLRVPGEIHHHVETVNVVEYQPAQATHLLSSVLTMHEPIFLSTVTASRLDAAVQTQGSRKRSRDTKQSDRDGRSRFGTRIAS